MRIALVVLMTLALGPVSAEHCWGSVSAPEIDLTPVGLPYYGDNDLCQTVCAFSVWFYEESNGIAGLQRGDEVYDETCHGLIRADTLVWGDVAWL